MKTRERVDVADASRRPWSPRPRCSACLRPAQRVIGHWLTEEACDAAFTRFLDASSSVAEPEPWMYLKSYACANHYEQVMDAIVEHVGAATSLPARRSWRYWFKSHLHQLGRQMQRRSA